MPRPTKAHSISTATAIQEGVKITKTDYHATWGRLNIKMVQELHSCSKAKWKSSCA